MMHDRTAFKNTLMLPMRVVQSYLLFSVALYFLGPLKWPTMNPGLLLLFLSLAQLALYSGYKYSIRNAMLPAAWNEISPAPPRGLKIYIIFGFVFLVLLTIRYSGLSVFTLSSLHEKLKFYLENPGLAYFQKTDFTPFGGIFLTYSAILLSPLWWPGLPLSLMNFGRLSKSFKLFTILLITLTPISAIVTGTNKGVVDWLIILAAIMFIKRIQYKLALEIGGRIKLKRRSGWFKLVVFLVMITMGIAFFSYNIRGRLGPRLATPAVSTGAVPIDHESIALRLCPPGFQPTLIYLATYIDQGYFALSLALPMPWTPLLGVGSSTFLRTNLLKEILGIDILPHSYQGKLNAEYGWIPGKNWPSIYVDLANDFHFVGVVLLMFILGFFFAEIVKDSVLLNDPMAIVLLCLLLIMFFYFPANNQVMASGYTFVTFWALAAGWFLKRLGFVKK